MRLPHSWLRELVDTDWSPKETAFRLTLCGTAAEVSSFSSGQFDNIVVGQIIEIEPIVGTDHLKKAMVDIGTDKLQIVCGAPNASKGQKVAIAKIGAKLSGEMEIKHVKLRGVESSGMICSEAELGLTDDHSGIMVLDDNAPIGEAIGKYLGLDDYVFGFDLTPNRSDSLSAIGIARDVACLAGKKINRESYSLSEVSQKGCEEISIEIDDIEACLRYAARVIKGVKIGPSPWWIKRKLLLSGIRPISNVVDITNLIMLELGHPLHAFDLKRFGQKKIVIKRAIDCEKFTTLDGKEHNLTPEVLLITDGIKGVAAAGVMGGLDSEVSSDTTDILLESAYFNPITIRKSRQKLGMISESSIRFEKGADPNMVPEAINRAAYLIGKYAGGQILSGIVDCYPKKIGPSVVALRPERVNKILGIKIKTSRMVEILKGLEFGVDNKANLEVTVPTFRPDITREIDLIEEIARIEGYDKIESADRNIGPLFTTLHDDDIFRQQVRIMMTGQGFDEISGTGFADPNRLSKLTNGRRAIKILNPIAEDLSVMRNTILYSLLTAVSHNISQRNIDLRLFEIGKSYIIPDDDKPLTVAPDEREEVGLALSGKSSDRWYGKGREYNFYDLKGAIDSLLAECRISAIKYSAVNKHPFRGGYGFCLILGEEMIGYAGQIREDLAKVFDIKQAVYMAALNFDLLLKNRRLEKIYEPLPRFPAAPRDLAIVVDDSIMVGEMMESIKKIGGVLLEKVEIFDLYKGKQIGDGKKSLAFSLSYRSNEGSLDGAEVADIQNKIIAHLKEYFKADIREG
jgi:phenylalanyl-tRNA synthetase beta chain